MAKYIIIGTSGIGGALARKLRADGADLHLISRNAQTLAVLAADLRVSSAVADVMQPDSLVEAIQAAGPSVDGLAYCVGNINLRPLSRVTDVDALKDFELHAVGALRSVRAALPALRATLQPTASILLFSTIAVRQGFPSHVSVAMAKGAVEGLTISLAAELAPKIRVNAIAPSLTRTPLASFITGNEQATQTIAGLHPLQRIGEPEDIAAMGALLLSSSSSWMTGQVIGIDGGRSTLRGKG